MKRLMYTQIFYDSVYFAFEGQWVYASTANETGLTPIGTLQQSAKSFFQSPNGTLIADAVHVPTIGVLIDFLSGWSRPCDAKPKTYSPVTWGTLAWDAADFFLDAVFEVVYPGYRAGALRHDEQGYLAPTPYGDVIDVLLSDALPEVLLSYDTVVVAHRLTSEPSEVKRKLEGFVAGGGHLVISASSVLDLGGTIANVTVRDCSTQQPNTVVTLSNGTTLKERGPFVQCFLEVAPAATTTILATVAGNTAAVRVVEPGGGWTTVIGVGGYGLNTVKNGNVYTCGLDASDGPENNMYSLVEYARVLLTEEFAQASLFDLGNRLSWVPKRISNGQYALVVTNSELNPVPLQITARVGKITTVTEMSLDSSEINKTGYLPNGFESHLPNLGENTDDQIAGVATRIFIVTVADDSTVEIPRAPAKLPVRRAIRLPRSTGSIRTELLKRPSFSNHYSGKPAFIEFFQLWNVS